MIWLCAALASSVVLDDDAAARAWIERMDRVHRVTLPVVGPALMNRFEHTVGGDVRFVHASPHENPEAVAIDVRLDTGSTCALLLAPLASGWLGSASGTCGMLGIGGWRWDGERVRDGLGNPVFLPQFAHGANDSAILRTYRRLDRAKSRGLWMGMLGGGALFVGALSRGRPESVPLQITGGAVLAVGGLTFLKVELDPRSHPGRLAAHYTEEQILARVRAHNLRMRIAVLPTGVAAQF